MTLNQFLSTLQGNVLVTVSDRSDAVVCRVYADSIGALDDDVKTRTVYKWDIKTSQTIDVVLNDVEADDGNP